jgi:hypothetical protein
MVNATQTKLIGVTVEITDIDKIETVLSKRNKNLPLFHKLNQQDFIREAIKELLAVEFGEA